MFNKGEFLVYNNAGLCEVMDVSTLKMEGVEQKKIYYVLRPYKRKSDRLFVPKERETTAFRAVMTEDDANELLTIVSEIEILSISNSRYSEEQYKRIIKEGESREVVSMIKLLYSVKQKKLSEKKAFSIVDERYFNLAKERLFIELSMVLDVSEEEIETMVMTKIA